MDNELEILRRRDPALVDAVLKYLQRHGFETPPHWFVTLEVMAAYVLDFVADEAWDLAYEMSMAMEEVALLAPGPQITIPIMWVDEVRSWVKFRHVCGDSDDTFTGNKGDVWIWPVNCPYVQAKLAAADTEVQVDYMERAIYDAVDWRIVVMDPEERYHEPRRQSY